MSVRICSQGDSGGPVIEYAGQKPVVVGIVSSGVECALPDYPGVNIRLAGMKEWLETTPAGYVVNTEEINEVIIRCSAGEYLKSEGVEPARCVKCEEGSVSKGGTSHICTTPKDDYEANGI